MTAPSDPVSVPGTDPTRRNVLILALAQGCALSSMSIMMSVTALIGATLAPSGGLATVPLSIQFVAVMVTVIPASMLMQRVGRRAGFTLGGLVGILGGALGALAIYWGDFLIFIAASVCMGVMNGFAQYFRFAAADTASAAFRPKAISLVMAGGVIAGFLGPQLADWTEEMFLPFWFLGSYLAIMGLSSVMVLLLQMVRIPTPTKAEQKETGRPLKVIFRQPKAMVAVIAAALGYATMTLMMTATPLAMQACGFDFTPTKTVIQWHAVAMFAPSFVTGHLIRSFGVYRIILAGAVLYLLTFGITLAGVDFSNFFVGLVLLGIGWNFLFVGGTALLTECYEPAEKAKVQAANDFTVFSTVAAASFLSGFLHDAIGWSAVSVAVLPSVVLVIGALALFRLTRMAQRFDPV